MAIQYVEYQNVPKSSKIMQWSGEFFQATLECEMVIRIKSPGE